MLPSLLFKLRIRLFNIFPFFKFYLNKFTELLFLIKFGFFRTTNLLVLSFLLPVKNIFFFCQNKKVALNKAGRSLFFRVYSTIKFRFRVFHLYFILVTAGSTKLDLAVILFLLCVFFTAPFLYFILLVRLAIILILFNGYAKCINKLSSVSVRLPQACQTAFEGFLAFLAFTIIFLIFSSQQTLVLCQGEKQLVSTISNVFKSLNLLILNTTTKPALFAPFNYFEHLVDSKIFKTIHEHVALHKRHEQSTLMNLFFLKNYPKVLGEAGVYMPINPHNLFGNDQPGNDFIGKYSFNGKNTLVVAEAKSTSAATLTDTQLVGLAPETQLFQYKKLENLLLLANIEGVLN